MGGFWWRCDLAGLPSCLHVTLTRWPVIAVIIVGGLIVFSVVWCIIRCACCGLSCCCECCQFMKCCGNCCGCCDPPRGKRHKYLDEPYIPPNQGYKMQPPMNPHFSPVVPAMTPVTTGVTTAGATQGFSSSAPQYAEFDVSKPKGGEDALPAMPSWDGADKKKVLVEEEAVEMDQLKKPQASAQPGATMAAAAIPGVSPAGSPGINRSPYGPPGGTQAGAPVNGYFPAPRGAEADPYGQSAQDYSGGGGYGQPSSLSANQGYGMAGGAMGMGVAMGQGRRSPYNDGGYGDVGYGDGGYGQQGRAYGQPVRQDSFNSYGGARQQGGGAYDSYGQENQGYGAGARRSPPMELAGDAGYGQPNDGYRQDHARTSPAPQAGYGNYDSPGYGGRQYSTESTRPLQPQPQRQYSHDPAPQTIQSDAGFDFAPSGYTRSPPRGNGYRQPSPLQTQQPVGYPGYKPYSPGPGQQQQGGGGW